MGYSYTPYDDEDLLADEDIDNLLDDDWDDFAAELLEDELPTEARGGCLRAFRLLVIVALLGAIGVMGIVYFLDQQEEDAQDDEITAWVDDTQSVIDAYQEQFESAVINCEAVTTEDTYQIVEIPSNLISAEVGTPRADVYNKMVLINDTLSAAQSQITRVCGDNETVSSAVAKQLAQPVIDQAQTSLNEIDALSDSLEDEDDSSDDTSEE